MIISLNDNWTLRAGDADPLQPIPVRVPGDVHSALLAAGLMADPFFGTQAEDCRWVEDRTWIYETTFDFNGAPEGSGPAKLVFHGLDTFATVHVNDREVGRSANMLIEHSFEIASALVTGTNRLKVVFDPVKNHVPAEPDPRMWYSYDTDRAWVRKAQFGWRWDWGPRILTVGLWREVELVVPGGAEIVSTFFRTESLENDTARVGLTLEVAVHRSGQLEAVVRLGEAAPFSVTVSGGHAQVQWTVLRPRLWWTHDLGEPFLYDLEIHLRADGKVLDSKKERVGIRTLELRWRAPDGRGLFQFVLNGIALFARGANWIPAHSLVGSVGDDDYRAWIDLARQGNMTMLRVWGGGLYEKPAFYEECDRQGLLVWQDFAFACSSYPDFDADFMANVETEVHSVVRRLRSHPCLALWCGNNEIEWIHEQKEKERPEERLYGRRIWEELMPRLLAELDPTRTYWPSSPFGTEDPNGDDAGDKHNWQVWAGQIYPQVKGEGVRADNSPAGVSFKHFAHDQAKFSSEFGMHAYPVRQTLEGCLPPEDLHYGSFGLKFRNKDKRPNRGKLLMEGSTGLPADLDQAIDFSMLAQAEGLKFGVEHYRRRPDCGGALVWQLNDCWPTLSWSVADFHRRPKAGYWALKRAFAPLILSWRDERPDVVGLWLVNDQVSAWQGLIEVEAADFLGHRVFRNELEARVAPLTSLKVAEFSKNRMNITYSNFEYLAARPMTGGPAPALLLFEDHKDLNLPPAALTARWLNPENGDRVLEVSSDRFTRMVSLRGDLDGVVLDDNYFDLEPGRTRTITLTSTDPRPRKLSLRALNAPSVELAEDHGGDGGRGA